MIGKIKPTIAIRAEVRVNFSEIEFIRMYLDGFRKP